VRLPDPQPFHLPTARGRRFCVRYEPAGGAAGTRAIVHVPAFAEEMNKSRRMVALQARALAAAGHTVVQPDLHGCGDSEGDHGDATWEGWSSDIDATLEWVEARTGRRAALWGLRSGCLLASDVARRRGGAVDLVLWQPVVSGAQALTQFLRMKVAAQLMGDSAERVGTREMIAALESGDTLEVSGYRVHPDLARGLKSTDLAPPGSPSRIAWLEVAGVQPPELTPAGASRVTAWRAAGHLVEARAVAGPSFWQTPELTECPALVEATIAAVKAIAS